MLRKYAFVLGFDGLNFSGSAPQLNVRTVEGEFRRALLQSTRTADIDLARLSL